MARMQHGLFEIRNVGQGNPRRQNQKKRMETRANFA